MVLVSWIANFNLAFPTAARWDLPSGAFASLVTSKEGFLAQGPEEKHALSGRVTGFFVSMSVTLPDNCLSLGRGVPRIEIIDNPAFNNSKNLVIGRDMKGLRSLAL